MSQPELLKLVARRLEEAGTGVHGDRIRRLEPAGRATRHARHRYRAVGSRAGRQVAGALKRAFPEPEFYLDAASARDAIAERGMFHLIDAREGDKVDFWLLTEEAFDQARFARRYVEPFEGVALHVCRPEDTILMKLRWAALLGGSDKQFVDALRVYEVQRGRLDRPTWTVGPRRWKLPTRCSACVPRRSRSSERAAAKAAHPERFPAGLPQPPALPVEARKNTPPKTRATEETRGLARTRAASLTTRDPTVSLGPPFRP